MGWWKIADVETGKVDFTHRCPTNPQCVNAIPGVDTEHAFYNGDGPADVMSHALDKIVQQYKDAWNRPPQRAELQAVFNFVVGGAIERGGGKL